MSTFLESKSWAGAVLPAFLALPAAAAEITPLDQVVVTAVQPPAEVASAPGAAAGVSADGLARAVNLQTPEDALRYLPDVLVRQRHVGDTQSPIATRTSGVGASARSLIYVDGMLISSLIGNNNTSASPKWGLVAPDAIARVDVLYGPFSAAYAGNSIGTVVLFTTRMPRALEGQAEVQGWGGGFSHYGEGRTVGGGRLAGEIGDRLGPAAFRLSYNHLDSWAQPLGYATALVPASPGAAGTPVTGAVAANNRTGQPIQVLGSTSIEHQTQDNLSGRATLDLGGGFSAAYAFGLFANADRAGASSWLRDGSGAPVYSGPVNIGGRAYAIAPSLFSVGVYRLDELDLAQGLSLTWRSDRLDLDLATSRFDTLSSRQRTPSGALPAAFSGGAGGDTVLDGTGWTTLDATAVWRAGLGETLSGGLHEDRFTLNNPRYAAPDWTRAADGALQAGGFGHTETQALWLQDQIAPLAPLKATLGLRLESWRAFGGLNVSTAPVLFAAQPALHAAAASPKASLAWDLGQGWTARGSVGVAYRFPTVSELYQAVSLGPVLAVPAPDLKPERALSSELAVERKAEWGSLRISLFDERIANALLSQTAPLPAGSTTLASFVQNVDRTRATGVEFAGERRDLFVRGFALQGWITYVDARIERDRSFAAAVGKALPQLPRWRGALSATWSPTARLDLSASARYSDRAFGTIDNSDHYADVYQGFDAWLVADVHLRWRASEHLQIEAGVDNLGARRYFLFHPFPQRTAVADLKYTF